jgi:DNA-binding transcriptional LysR family regulator
MPTYSVNSLIVFCEVVKSKSFSKAAANLSMTQPGVSNHVSQLEAQTGVKLLNRERGKCELTKEGKVVFRYAERMHQTSRELEDAIRLMTIGARQMIRIGTTPTYSRLIMPYILGGFQKKYPEIGIKLDAGSSGEMVKTLFSMQNDIIIAANLKISRKLHSIPLLKEELVLITGIDHELSRRDRVSLSELGKYPLIIREEGSATREVVLSALASMNINPSFLIEAKSADFIKEWVSQGKGISISIERAITSEEKNQLRLTPFQESLFLEISALFLKSRKHERSIMKFTGHLTHLKL